MYLVNIGGGNLRKTTINIPEEIDKMVSEYQKENGMTSWISALYELARKGYENTKK